MGKIQLLYLVLFTFFLINIQNIIGASDSDSFDITIEIMESPSDLGLSLTMDADVQITWTKGTGSDTTLIRRKPDSYPTGISDGTEIYNSTGTNYIDGDVTTGNTYYYRAWSFNSTYSLFSDPIGNYIYISQPALFDIRNIIILDGITTDLNIVCTVSNEGGLEADFVATWTLTRVDTGAILDTGTDTFAVEPSEEKLYYVTPSTSYVGLCRISITGNNASASQLFTTTAPSEDGDGGGGGGGGGGGSGDGTPYSRDSDGDGLTDAEEEFYGTDPYKKDTDGDGWDDYKEIQQGTDPLDANDYPGKTEINYLLITIIATTILVAFLLIFFIFYRERKKKTTY